MVACADNARAARRGGGFHRPEGDQIIQRIGDAAPAGSGCLLQFLTASGISFAKCCENAFCQATPGQWQGRVSGLDLGQADG
jgi:hypothetical protein